MRHRVKTNQFGRSTKDREALIKSMTRSLIETGSITTSKEKAREIKRWADKLIHKAQTDSLIVRRQLHTFFGKRDVVNTLVERIAPAMKDRSTGFTTTAKVGKRRGDNSELVKLSLVVAPKRVGTLKAETKKTFGTKANKATIATKASEAAPAKKTAKKSVAKVAKSSATASKKTKKA